MGRNNWDKKDTAERDGVSVKEVSNAWHQAREDAASSRELEERNENKVSDSEDGSTLYDIFKGIFGK
ncbi:MAG: hypothetical protein AAB461_00820 [Patescibacteria group bacterium]